MGNTEHRLNVDGQAQQIVNIPIVREMLAMGRNAMLKRLSINIDIKHKVWCAMLNISRFRVQGERSKAYIKEKVEI